MRGTTYAETNIKRMQSQEIKTSRREKVNPI